MSAFTPYVAVAVHREWRHTGVFIAEENGEICLGEMKDAATLTRGRWRKSVKTRETERKRERERRTRRARFRVGSTICVYASLRPLLCVLATSSLSAILVDLFPRQPLSLSLSLAFSHFLSLLLFIRLRRLVQSLGRTLRAPSALYHPAIIPHTRQLPFTVAPARLSTVVPPPVAPTRTPPTVTILPALLTSSGGAIIRAAFYKIYVCRRADDAAAGYLFFQ